MNPGDLVKLTEVARLYSGLDLVIHSSSNTSDTDQELFGVLLRKRTSEFTEDDIDNLGLGSHIWDVFVNGKIEKIWEIDMAVINNPTKDSNMLDLDCLSTDENFSHLSRVVRILKDGRF